MQFNYLRTWSYPLSLLALAITVVVAILTTASMRLLGAASQVSVGPYRVEAFPSGLAVFMDTESWHYAISPLNDYLLTDTGIRYALLTGDGFSHKLYTNSTDRSHALQVYESITSQLDLRTPWYSFTATPYTGTYTVLKRPNALKVTRWLKLPPDHTYTETGITFTYNPDDYVYDPSNNNLYTERTPQEMSTFHKITNTHLIPIAAQQRQKLTPGQNLPRTRIEAGSVIVTNLAYPGGLKITAEPGQTLFINPDNHSIELALRISTPAPDYIQIPLTIDYLSLGSRP